MFCIVALLLVVFHDTDYFLVIEIAESVNPNANKELAGLDSTRSTPVMDLLQ